MSKNYIFAIILLLGLQQATAQEFSFEINEELQGTAKRLVNESDQITSERKEQLAEIATFILENTTSPENFSVLFVCTHNSRRSHIADTWFKFGLLYFGLAGYDSYSGGLEATAFNPNAAAALERAGFTVAYKSKVQNPVVSISPGRYPVWKMKSKVYTHKVNPTSNFVAIMVCSDADESCPLVDGAVGRFAVPYDDPRYYDNTPSQQLKYDQTVSEIGGEMLYLTGYLKSQMILAVESSN